MDKAVDEEHQDFATVAEIGTTRQPYRFVVVALYLDVEIACNNAELLTQSGVPPEDISVLVSEGKLQETVEQGISLVPPVAFQGVNQEGVLKGAVMGGAAGLVLGTEIVLLGTGAVFALPVLAGVTLLGIATGAVWDASFRKVDLALEGTGYRMHLHQGGALLVVHAKHSRTADAVMAVLRETQPMEIQRHPLGDLSHQ